MRRVLALMVVLIAGGCAERAAEQAPDTATAVRRELTREEAIAAAKRLVAESRVDSLIYLDSVQVTLEPTVWRVAFRRRWMAAPFQMTIDVDRRTGAARFLGDE
jgi:hypothetical protein